MVFGGGGSPLIWGRAAALLGRSGQSLFVTSELIVEIYVDDPWILLRGSPEVRKRNAVILFLWWQAMGPKLAFHKTERGRKVQWIGAEITLVSDKELKIGLPEKMIVEMKEECEALLQLPAVPLRRLRRFVGRGSWCAGLVKEMGPFLSVCWAAIADCAAACP